MADIRTGRWTAEIDGDFVIFLIGVRFNKPWKLHKVLPVLRAMPRMIKELQDAPERGLLHLERYKGAKGLMLAQYWRSFEHLHAYARDKESEHLPAWAMFHKKIGFDGDVGIWHETYKVRAGEYECIYGNMPDIGLGLAGKLVPATGSRKSAQGRMGITDGEDYPNGIMAEHREIEDA